MTFDEAFDKLIDHEGGYVNDPRDPGGETKFGISKRQYPNLDIKNLTRDDAKLIYRTDYWERAGCDQIDPAVAFNIFDAAVNSGIENSVRFMQRACGVADDGHAGPVTLNAVRSMPPVRVVARFNGERLEFLAKLTTFDHFGRGWTRRVADNLKAA